MGTGVLSLQREETTEAMRYRIGYMAGAAMGGEAAPAGGMPGRKGMAPWLAA